jgi:peptidoglycan-associated lipoprotein
LREICGIDDDHAYFDFNSSKVASKDNRFLEQLVTCFSTGPMAGKTLRLVGHADPRGEDSYNLALGERRAQSVRKALVQSGLPSERVSATSRGELDASGTEESEWARDRRVDIVTG